MPTNDQIRALTNRGVPYGIAKNAVDIPRMNHTALTGGVSDTLPAHATVDANLTQNVKTLATKVNLILDALDGAGITY